VVRIYALLVNTAGQLIANPKQQQQNVFVVSANFLPALKTHEPPFRKRQRSGTLRSANQLIAEGLHIVSRHFHLGCFLEEELVWPSAAISTFMIYKHLRNIQRLIQRRTSRKQEINTTQSNHPSHSRRKPTAPR
jgi:hypothetical protein